jgi:hypothetical protein
MPWRYLKAHRAVFVVYQAVAPQKKQGGCKKICRKSTFAPLMSMTFLHTGCTPPVFRFAAPPQDEQTRLFSGRTRPAQ